MVTLGWGIVGCGWVASEYVAPAIRASDNGRLVAVHDVSAAAMDRMPDAAACASLHDLLTHPGVDAIYVATANDSHRAVVEAAAAAGIAVLCEKPMARDADEAAAMLRACRTAGVAYATAFDQRYHATHRHLAGLVADGALGRVTAIRIVYACWVGTEWAADNWRIDRNRAGGGALIDLAPHGLDLAAMLLDEQLVDVVALGQRRVHDYPDRSVEDGAMLLARSRGGVLVQLHVAYNCPETYPRRRLEVIGTRAQAVAVDTMGQLAGGSLTLIEAATGEAQSVDVAGAQRSPFLNQVEAFAACLLQGRAPPYPGEDDVALMRLIDRAQDQIRAPHPAPA